MNDENEDNCPMCGKDMVSEFDGSFVEEKRCTICGEIDKFSEDCICHSCIKKHHNIIKQKVLSELEPEVTDCLRDVANEPMDSKARKVMWALWLKYDKMKKGLKE